MELSVVVVTRNNCGILQKCLESALIALKGLEGEIAVVDNASGDETATVLASKFPSIRIIRNATNLHYTRAVNQGMRATDGKYIFLLNDDTEIAPDCFRQLIAFMEAHPRCGALGPLMKSPNGGTQVSAQKFPTPFRESLKISGIAWFLRNKPWASSIQLEYPQPLRTQLVDWVCGGALFVRRSAMALLELHDEKYLFYRDDPDIGMRMRKAGFEVWYCTDSYVVHHHGVSSFKTPSKVRFDLIGIRSRRHYHRKFFGLPGCLAVEFTDGLCTLLRGLKAAVSFKRDKAAKHFRDLARLFQAIPMPREEADAIEGYRHASYNGTPEEGQKERQSRLSAAER